MATKSANRIREAVERGLESLLKSKTATAKEKLQALNVSVKYLAVSAKIDEESWGSDLDKDLDLEGGDNESTNDI